MTSLSENPISAEVERALLNEIAGNPADIVHRLQRLNSTTHPERIMAVIEETIHEMIRLRCALRLTR